MNDSPEITDIRPFIGNVANGAALNTEQAEAAFNIIMSGHATNAQIGALLMALRVRGETVDEITGATRAMRAKMLPIDAPNEAMDIVGTGGDGSGTYNISTAAAIVVAACGVPVAKHGNKALSSKSGAADVLTSIGVNIDADMALVREALFEANIGFLMAPRHHSAMKHVGPARVELATRTIFNLLGPLCNPAGVKRQFTGVYDRDWIEPLAVVLGQLGSRKVWIVHGSDGLDELTTTGPSYVAEWNDGVLSEFEITPADANLPEAYEDDLKGGTPEENAAAMKRLLDGEEGAYRDIVLLNAAGALMVADKVTSLAEGAEVAAEAIDSGKAINTLNKLITITNQTPA